MPDFEAPSEAELPHAHAPGAEPAPSHPRQMELTALRLLTESRSRQRNLQQEVARKAEQLVSELSIMARAADLGMLFTFLELARAEARLERERWESPRP